MDINTQLRQLFTFESELNQLLKDEEYERFEQRQGSFSDQINTLINTNSQDVLGAVIDDLKRLEKAVIKLQSHSEDCYQRLKEKSLAQKRNKSNIKEYGK